MQVTICDICKKRRQNPFQLPKRLMKQKAGLLQSGNYIFDLCDDCWNEFNEFFVKMIEKNKTNDQTSNEPIQNL